MIFSPAHHPRVAAEGLPEAAPEAGSGRRHLNLLLAAAENVATHARVYGVAAAAWVLALALLLSGVAISEGLKAEALAGVQAGADVFCTWDQFGRFGPVPADQTARLARIDGVVRAVPRIIGRLALGDEIVIIVGVPLSELARESIEVDGRLPITQPQRPQVLLGNELARSLRLKPGDRLVLEGDVATVFEVSGVASGTASLWSAKALVCDLEEAALLFGQPDAVSDICLFTRPGYADRVKDAVESLDGRYRAQTKEQVQYYVMSGMTVRQGIVTALFALLLAAAVPTFAMLTYLGAASRRREISLLKAEGWSTGDVLEMVAFENLLVSLFSAVLALALALVIVRGLNAPLVAPLFIAELPWFPAVRIPARFALLPPALSLIFSLVVTMSGSIPAAWRTARSQPAEAMR